MTKEQFADLEEQLREALRKTGLSHHELGRRCGVSQPVLSRFLSGERTLTLPIAAKVCRALGLRLCPAIEEAGAIEEQKSVKKPKGKRNKKQ